jgi:hypothetical protein
MKNFAGIAGTKFGSEAVMKSEAAFQNFETPPLRPEVPLLAPKSAPCRRKVNKSGCFPAVTLSHRCLSSAFRILRHPGGDVYGKSPDANRRRGFSV